MNRAKRKNPIVCVKPSTVVPGLLGKTSGGIEPPFTTKPFKRKVIVPENETPSETDNEESE